MHGIDELPPYFYHHNCAMSDGLLRHCITVLYSHSTTLHAIIVRYQIVLSCSYHYTLYNSPKSIFLLTDRASGTNTISKALEFMEHFHNTALLQLVSQFLRTHKITTSAWCEQDNNSESVVHHTSRFRIALRTCILIPIFQHH